MFIYPMGISLIMLNLLAEKEALSDYFIVTSEKKISQKIVEELFPSLGEMCYISEEANGGKSKLLLTLATVKLCNTKLFFFNSKLDLRHFI